MRFRYSLLIVLLCIACLCGAQTNSAQTLSAPQGNRGFTGARGPAGILRIGTVVSAPPGASASVTNVGSTSNAVLNFTIPRGSAWYSGNSTPTSDIGLQGDFFFDTLHVCIYGPKGASTWPSTCTTVNVTVTPGVNTLNGAAQHDQTMIGNGNVSVNTNTGTGQTTISFQSQPQFQGWSIVNGSSVMAYIDAVGVFHPAGITLDLAGLTGASARCLHVTTSGQLTATAADCPFFSNATTLAKITESGGLPLWNGGAWPGGGTGGTTFIPNSIYLSIKDAPYNCHGDGTTDDTACVQQAIDDAEASIGTGGITGATVFFPKGTYVVGCTAPIRVHKSGMTLEGISKTGSMIGPSGACGGSNGTWFINAETAANMSGALINYSATNLLTGGTKALLINNPDGNEEHIDLRSTNTGAEVNGLAALTVEATVKPTAINSQIANIIKSAGARDSVVPNNEAFEISFAPNGALSCKLNVGGTLYSITSAAAAIVANGVYHTALSYDGTTIKCFLNGVSVGTPQTVSGTVTQDLTEGVFIGCDPSNYFPNRCNGQSTRSMQGVWDGVRISKVARYTANFTPPTAKFTSADSNTLIACPFNTQYDTATECIIPGSGNSAKVWVNTDRNYCPGTWHATDISHLGFSAGGLFINNGSGVKIEDVGIGGNGITQYGLNIGGTCNFEIHMQDVWFQGLTGRYAANIGTGVARLENMSINGARYGLIAQSNTTLDDIFFGSFSNSIVPLIVRGQAGIANYVNIRNMQWDGEFSAPNYVANIILDSVDQGVIATSWIGSSQGPTTAVPVIINSVPWSGDITFEGNYFTGGVGQPVQVKYNTIGAVNQLQKQTTKPLRFSHNTQGFVVLPWTDAPNAVIENTSLSGKGQFPFSVTLNNDTSTGTFPAAAAIINSSGNAVVAAVNAATVAGITVPSTNTTWQADTLGNNKKGTSELAFVGPVFCGFDNATTSGDYVVMSALTHGCHDFGSSTPSSGMLGRTLDTKAQITVDPNTPFAIMSSGGTLAAGTYQYCTTYITSTGGETPCSAPRSYVIAAPNQTLDILPPSLYDTLANFEEAAGWRVYLTAPGGSTFGLQPANSTVCGSAAGLANSPLSGCNFSTHTIYTSYTAAGAAAPVTNTAGKWVRVMMSGVGSSGGGGTQPDWTQSNSAAADFIKNKPSLATVATSGSYNDLTSKPTIPAGPPYTESQVTSLVTDLAAKQPNLASQHCNGTDKVTGFDSSGTPQCATDNTVGGSAASYQATSYGNSTSPAFWWDEGVSGKSGLWYSTAGAEVDVAIRGSNYYRMAFNAFIPNSDNAIVNGMHDFYRWQEIAATDTYTQKVHLGVPNSYACDILYGSGSPEGVVTANHCSMFLRTDGGAGTSMYVKETGTGNTGWVAK